MKGFNKGLALSLALALVWLMAAPAAASCGSVCCAPAPEHHGQAMEGKMAGQMDGQMSALPQALLRAPGCCCDSAADDCASRVATGQGGQTAPDRAVSTVRADINFGQAQVFTALYGQSRGEKAARMIKAPPRAGPLYLSNLSLLI